MTRSAKKPKEYHHGDLRRAVLKGAFAEVKRGGLRALTLREVARKIGVTHAAPYHHFKDRDALLDAMAEEAFGELDALMAERKRGVSEPAEQLLAVGRAYVDFALARPERIEVMFRRKGQARPPVENEAGARAFGHLVEAIAACQTAGTAPAGEPMALALSAWSLVHGFALLWIEGPLSDIPFYANRFEELRERMLLDLGSWLRAAARS